jgi:hypothetical protein
MFIVDVNLNTILISIYYEDKVMSTGVIDVSTLEVFIDLIRGEP